MNADLLSAVLEAYTPEGVVIWITGWIHASPEQAARMESGVIQEWSGTLPDRISQDASKDADA